MRKFSMIVAVAAVTGLAAMARAGELNLWFDIRNNTEGLGGTNPQENQLITTPGTPFTVGQGEVGTVNTAFSNTYGPAGGNRGGGQILRLCPTVGTLATQGAGGFPNFDHDGNASTGDLWLYADINDDETAAGAGDVISSIGIDIGVATVNAAGAATGYKILSSSFAWENFDTVVSNSGKTNGGGSVGGAGGSLTGIKYVKVPVDTTTSLYATTGGLTPGSAPQPVRIGKLRVTANTRNSGDCFSSSTSTHLLASSYNVNMSVNNLLITRTFSNVVADTDEKVSFGYTTSGPETAVSGNTIGNGSAGLRDAIIEVRLKGDVNGDGRTSANDIGGFTGAQNAGLGINQVQRYLYDRNNDGKVSANDIGAFTLAQNSACP